MGYIRREMGQPMLQICSGIHLWESAGKLGIGGAVEKSSAVPIVREEPKRGVSRLIQAKGLLHMGCLGMLKPMSAQDFGLTNRRMGRDPLVIALIASLVVHLALYGTWQVGKNLGWWRYHPNWLTQLSQKLAQAARAREQKPKPAAQELTIPLSFVEIDPLTSTPEPPADAKYYSSKNSKAANPDPKNEPIPKVDGNQDKVVRLMDNEKPKPFPLQPTPKPPEPEPPVETKPKQDAPGELALVRPREPKPPTDAQEPGTGEQPERPRRLSQVRDRAMLSGQKMQQAGGSRSLGRVSFDAKATPFGDYDAAFIAAVESCWHLLLDEHRGTARSGKVVVDFRLSYDGRITDLKVQENDAGEILGMLCQSAILNPSPYPRWPPQMRQTISSNSREMRFTFYYN
jgi:hypothetical protein